MEYDFTILNSFERNTSNLNHIKRLYNNIEIFNIFNDINDKEQKIINLNNYSQWQRIFEIFSKKEVDKLFHNFEVNISNTEKITKNFNDFHNSLEFFEDFVNYKIELIKQIAKNNMLISNELDDKISNIINLLNSDKYKKDLNELMNGLDKNIETLDTLKKTIMKCIENLKEQQPENMIPENYEINIFKNEAFQPLIEFQLKYKDKLQSLMENNLLEECFLKDVNKNIRDNLKDIYNIFYKNKIFLSQQDKICYELNEGNVNKYGMLCENDNNFGFKAVIKTGAFLNDVVYKRDNKFITVYDSIDAVEMINKEAKLIIKNKFNKNPIISKYLFNKMDDFLKVGGASSYSIKEMVKLVSNYLNKKDILDNYNFDFINEFNKSFDIGKNSYYSKIFENFEDKTKKIIRTHNVKNFAKSITSNKYNNLFNEESIKIIGEIYDLKLKKDTFQQYVGKKIAKYKTSEEFNESLLNFLKSFNSFNNESIINIANDCGASVVFEDPKYNTLILKIDTFEQSKRLGSTSWCISSQENYFNSYVQDGGGQYFFYNFMLEQTNEQSVIGLTMDANNEFHVGFYKDDTEIEEKTPEIEYAIDVIQIYVEDSYKNDKIYKLAKNRI